MNYVISHIAKRFIFVKAIVERITQSKDIHKLFHAFHNFAK
jgi:hypothetical protein